MRHGVAGLLDDDILELDPADTDLRRRLNGMPAAALGSVRHRLTDDEIDRALAAIRQLDVRFLHYIGGNDSAHTSLDLAKAAAYAGYELFVAGIPKTVDNDLPEMDHSPGFASAARFLAMAVVDAGLDTRAMRRTDPVKVIEVGGRNAGWLAAAASLGRREESEAPHLVYLPEQPLDPEGLLHDVERALHRFGWVVIVVSEGIRTISGQLLEAGSDGVHIDRFGHPQLGGAGRTIAGLIARHCNVRVKYDRPGSLQRLLRAYRSPVDVREARRAGRAAVRFAVAGHTGIMAALHAARSPHYRSWFTPVPLAEIANREKLIPDDMLMAAGDYPGPALREYGVPLVGDLHNHDDTLLVGSTLSYSR
jgi:6-phosphofructokinase 1